MVKFLIIRFSSIGDIILTTPVIRSLKTQVEDAEIHFLTKKQYASLLTSNPHVDRLHLFSGDMKDTLDQIRKEKFDYIIDLHHNLRTSVIKSRLRLLDFSVNKLNLKKWLLVNLKVNRMPDKHMVDRNMETLKAFDIHDDGEGLDYFIPKDEEVDIGNPGKEFTKGYIAVAIGAQHATKKLPVEKLIELLKLIEHPIIIIGGPEDKEVGDVICEALPSKIIYNACGNYSINQSASLVRQARLLFSHDTGMMHVGAAFKKITLSVWGSTDPVFGMYPYRADSKSVKFEVKDLACRPCSKIGYDKCPKGHFKCMNEQDISGIAERANALFIAP